MWNSWLRGSRYSIKLRAIPTGLSFEGGFPGFMGYAYAYAVSGVLSLGIAGLL